MYRMPPWLRWPRVVLIAFCTGALADFWLASRLPTRAAPHATPDSQGPAATVATSGRPSLPGLADVPGIRSGSRQVASDAVAALRGRGLTLPIDGADAERWQGSFDEVHSGHKHEAVDILAPRRTPVRAVDAGTIARLFTSKAGGLTIYQFDPGREFVYYYAHLDSYEPALREGDPVAPGQVIAYVGTTGNAPPDTPHLHFAISRLASGEGWWQGTAVDPYEVFAGR